MATVPTLASTAAAVIDADTGDIVWSKALDTQLRQASTTKTMTLLLLCEYNPALDDLITVSATAAGETGSSAGIAAGEVYTAHDIALGMMLPSGNDAATAIAEHVGQTYLGAGSAAAGLTAFVARMNARAVELGMDDTAYQNAHGMDAADPQYTTARDLARLGQVCFANAAAVAIAGTVAHAGIPVSGGSTARNWEHGNYLLGAYQVVCGKGGNTPMAGRSLVVRYDVDGRRLIGVVLGAPSNDDRNDDTIAALEYARETLGLTGTLTGIATTVNARVNDGFGTTSYLPALYEHGFGAFSATTGKSFTYLFWGTACAIVAPTSNARGIATLTVDGGAAVDVDFYSASATKGVTVHAVSGLTDGPHTIVLTVAGRKHPASSGYTVALDEFHVTRVIGASSADPTTYVLARRDRADGGAWTALADLPIGTAADLPQTLDFTRSLAGLPSGWRELAVGVRTTDEAEPGVWVSAAYEVAAEVVDPPPDGAWFAVNGTVYLVLAEGMEALEPEPAWGGVVRSAAGPLLSTAAGVIRAWRLPLYTLTQAEHATLRTAIRRRRRATVGGLVFGPDLASGFAATVELVESRYVWDGAGFARAPVLLVRTVEPAMVEA